MTLADLETQPHALYRFFNSDGRLLYVGITNDPGRRWREHAGDKPWWHEVTVTTIERFATRGEVRDAEKAAIVTEKPLYNVEHQDRTRVVIDYIGPYCVIDVEPVDIPRDSSWTIPFPTSMLRPPPPRVIAAVALLVIGTLSWALMFAPEAYALATWIGLPWPVGLAATLVPYVILCLGRSRDRWLALPLAAMVGAAGQAILATSPEPIVRVSVGQGVILGVAYAALAARSAYLLLDVRHPRAMLLDVAR